MVRNLGAPELLVILGVFVFLFGATRLPALARSLGQSVREFRRGVEEASAAVGADDGASDDPEPTN